MSKREKDKEVQEFISSIINALPYYFDKNLMDSFEVCFQYKGKKYKLVLVENDLVDNIEFNVNLN